jgi:RNA-directed DNA polymerase
MPVEPRGPAVQAVFIKKGGRGEMTKTPISLQDLRRRLYVKAKTEPTWRFWGLYVHVCKRETLREAYLLAKANDGAPGIDGVTFAAVEAGGVEKFLDQLREEMVERTYRPQRARKVEIPKGGGKMRQLSIPTVSANCTRAQFAFGMDGDPSSVPSASRPALSGFEGTPNRRY